MTNPIESITSNDNSIVVVVDDDDIMIKSNPIMIEKTINFNSNDHHIENRFSINDRISNTFEQRQQQQQQKFTNQFEITDSNRNQKIISSKYELLLLIEQFKQGISIEIFRQLFNEWEMKYLDNQ
ncbi:hypothetical protein DERP_001584 [Dermatophagoides pteronyssinus]|uniref:Uncharacterized protein n=1 Tax=Dermatophagoides pteronyssinus TaxID=6956 RepID=A0ABQ8JAY8_DERPT|nr:hypothetical protein DERP_001584 [Dermatophagoides pteronyssinus]